MLEVADFGQQTTLDGALTISSLYGLDKQAIDRKLRLFSEGFDFVDSPKNDCERIHQRMQLMGKHLYPLFYCEVAQYFREQKQVMQMLQAHQKWHWKKLFTLLFGNERTIEDIQGTNGFPKVIEMPGKELLQKMEVLERWYKCVCMWEQIHTDEAQPPRSVVYSLGYHLDAIQKGVTSTVPEELLLTLSTGNLVTLVNDLERFLHKLLNDR